MSVRHEMRLAALSAEAIDLICRYLNGEKLFALILTGDRLLNAKMRQSRSLTVLWPTPTRVAWNQSLSLISSFPKLKELSLRASSLLQLPSPSSWNADLLPSHLTHLELRFRGAFALIYFSSATDQGKFQNFPSLKHLFLEQTHDQAGSSGGKMMLSGLPLGLEHLHIHVTDAPEHMYKYSTSDWSKLPADLRTFDVQLKPILPPNREDDTSIDFGHAGLSSLTHLSTEAPPSCIVDLKHVASTLKRLSIKGVVAFNGQLLFTRKEQAVNSWTPGLYSLTTPRTSTFTPVRSIFPRLESLKLPLGFMLSWDVLESLPLSMTRIHAEFPSPGDIGALEEKLARFNALYLREKGDDRPGAPMMLRDFFCPNSICLLSKYFINLECWRIPSDAVSAETVPRHMRTLEVEKVSGDLTLLPPSLTSLYCASLDLPRDKFGSLNGPLPVLASSLTLPSLAELTVTILPLNSVLISILPRTLESLDVSVEFALPLRELKERVDSALNGLPRLSSLSVHIPMRSATQVDTSMRTLPRTIKRLTLVGKASVLEPHDSKDCLRHHPSLTFLEIKVPQPAALILSQLPKQLLHLKAIFDAPIDLNLPSTVDNLLRLPPHLQTLHLSHTGDMHMEWLTPIDRLSPSFAKLKHLFAGKHASLLGLNLYLPGSLWSDELVYLVCENFVLDCLPSSLFDLSLPFNNKHFHGSFFGSHEAATGRLTRLLETRLFRPLDTFKRAVITRLPLLGLHLSTRRLYESDGIFSPLPAVYAATIIDRLPPHLSRVAGPRNRDYSDQIADKLLAKPKPTDWASPNILVARCWFHALNLCTWLPLAYLHRNQLTFATNPVGWSFKWINILGSAIAAPRIAMRVMRTHPGLLAPDLDFALGWGFWLVVSWFTAYSGAVAFNYSGSRWSTAARASAFTAWLVGEVCAQIGLKHAF